MNWNTIVFAIIVRCSYGKHLNIFVNGYVVIFPKVHYIVLWNNPVYIISLSFIKLKLRLYLSDICDKVSDNVSAAVWQKLYSHKKHPLDKHGRAF